MAAIDRELHDRFRGCLLGMAVGDALAFPLKGRSRTFVRALPKAAREAYERHPSGFFPRGQTSDDSQGALAVARALLEAGGAVDEAAIRRELGRAWSDGLMAGASAHSAAGLARLARGEPRQPPGAPLEADALSRAVPLGLLRHAAPDRLRPEVELAVGLTHDEPRILAAAAAIGGAVAFLVGDQQLHLGRFLDAMAQAAGRFDGSTAAAIEDFPRLLSMTEYRALEALRRYAVAQGAPAGLSFWDSLPNHPLLMAFGATYYFLRSPFEPEQALRTALEAGGENTTLCALAGALVGAFLGEGALPAPLLSGLQGGAAVAELASALADLAAPAAEELETNAP